MFKERRYDDYAQSLVTNGIRQVSKVLNKISTLTDLRMDFGATESYLISLVLIGLSHSFAISDIGKTHQEYNSNFDSITRMKCELWNDQVLLRALLDSKI